MLIKFFLNGKGAGAGPVGYLIAREVLAYDANRDLVRDADGQPLTVLRDPLPEVLRGDPSRTEALIDASRHQWTYRAGVISFAAEDAPSEAQQTGDVGNLVGWREPHRTRSGLRHSAVPPIRTTRRWCGSCSRRQHGLIRPYLWSLMT